MNLNYVNFHLDSHDESLILLYILEEQMNELKGCPYCDGDLIIKKVKCSGCETEIAGSFKTNRFHMFDEEQLYFIEMFLKSEGSIKQVEKELGISYPTVKSRLNKIIEILGYRTPESKINKPKKKLSTLEMLEAGNISFDDAMKELGGDK